MFTSVSSHSNDSLFCNVASYSSLISLSQIHNLLCLQTITKLIKHFKKSPPELDSLMLQGKTHGLSLVIGLEFKNGCTGNSANLLAVSAAIEAWELQCSKSEKQTHSVLRQGSLSAAQNTLHVPFSVPITIPLSAHFFFLLRHLYRPKLWKNT